MTFGEWLRSSSLGDWIYGVLCLLAALAFLWFTSRQEATHHLNGNVPLDRPYTPK